MTPIDDEYGTTSTSTFNPTGEAEPLGGKSPAELESEINQIRADMDSTLDAIERRFSPGEIVDRVLHDMGSVPMEFATNLGRAIRDNPIPSTLVGIGVGWLLLSEAGVTAAAAEKTHEWKETAARKGAELQESEGRTISRAKGKLQEKRHALREKGHAFSERMHHTGERLHEIGERARDRRLRLTEGASSLTRTIRDNPVPTAVACIGLGWLFMSHGGATDVAAAKTGEWRETGGRATSGARRKFQEKTHSLSEEIHEKRERLSEGMQEKRERFSEGLQEKRERLHEFGEKARETRGRVTERAQMARDQFRHLREDQPILFTAFGVAVGVVLGAMLPMTRKEEDILGETGATVRHKAREIAAEKMEKAREVTGAAMEAAREETEQQLH